MSMALKKNGNRVIQKSIKGLGHLGILLAIAKPKLFGVDIIKEIKGDAEYPKVYILHGDLSIDELYSLYSHNKVNCYLTLTKGEGYGLPLLESARCGLPIIATNWSGHLDFLEQDFLQRSFALPPHWQGSNKESKT